MADLSIRKKNLWGKHKKIKGGKEKHEERKNGKKHVERKRRKKDKMKD